MTSEDVELLRNELQALRAGGHWTGAELREFIGRHRITDLTEETHAAARGCTAKRCVVLPLGSTDESTVHRELGRAVLQPLTVSRYLLICPVHRMLFQEVRNIGAAVPRWGEPGSTWSTEEPLSHEAFMRLLEEGPKRREDE